MPETKLVHLDSVLERFEDIHMTAPPLSRNNDYQEILACLNSEGTVPANTINRILTICVHDLHKDMKYAANSIAVITASISKIKTENYSQQPDLLPSAVAILKIVKTVATLNNYEALKTMAFDALGSYPDKELVALATTCSADFYQVVNNYSLQKDLEGIRQKLFQILTTLLKNLPPEKKQEFVEEGLSIWFSSVIPALTTSPNLSCCIETLELLTESLLSIDYIDNAQWNVFLENIYNPKKFPKFMIRLLETGSEFWHRLCIVFIKLLKTQITKINIPGTGSPLNSMLPVVELAFKMDPISRCRAFQCWDALIDNFTKDQKDAYFKRIKLLIIPLLANNAKVPEIAAAKFNTWWHLIKRLYYKMDKLTDMILMPFLIFCFGKHNAAPKSPCIPGELSEAIKMRGVEALVEIAGHLDCEGCVDTILHLEGRLLSTKILVDHWKDWMHALKVSILRLAEDCSDHSMKQMRCLWMSFAIVIGDLPKNNIRKDLFSEFLSLIEQLLKESQVITDKVVNVLVGSLFENALAKQLLHTKDQQNSPIFTILSIVQYSINHYNQSHPSIMATSHLRPILDFALDEFINPNRILEDLHPNANALLLWTVLAEAITESKYDIHAHNLCYVLLWPLKNMNKFADEISEAVWYSWYTLYSLVHPKISKTIDNDIATCLSTEVVQSPSAVLMLCASLAVLKRNLAEGGSISEKEVDVLTTVLSEIGDYSKITRMFPILVDTLVLLLNRVTNMEHILFAPQAVQATGVVLTWLIQEAKTQNDQENNTINFIENLLKPIDVLLQEKKYINRNWSIIKELMDFVPHIKEASLNNMVFGILRTYLTKSTEKGTSLYTTCKDLVNAVENKSSSVTNAPITTTVTQDPDNNNFTAPNTKTTKGIITKTSKKKEANIVNTVVENGEEFVVVKSHWKFNPKKLTENQKEKLKRKREDIPALYQDLSQSQDEFKLTAWTTDSQDKSSTSKSTSQSNNATEEISTILKNLPSSDIVPQIMENITSEKVNEKLEAAVTSPQVQSPAVKDAKRPRLALKDRVIRNVRNLMEKSNLQEAAPENLNATITESIPKTPKTKTKQTLTLVSSAPPKINSDRPSRVIKKPKKFDDTEILLLKKRRRSQNGSPIENQTLQKPVYDTSSLPETTKADQNDCLISSSVSILDNIELQNNQCIQTVPIDLCNEKDSRIPLLENPESLQNIEVESETAKSDDKLVNKDDRPVDKNVDKNIVNVDESTHADASASTDSNTEISTPKPTKKNDDGQQKSSVKKKRSLFERQLLIDMVEGHPFLQVQSEKRVTRKNLLNTDGKTKRKSLAEKFSSAKSQPSIESPKADKKSKEKNKCSPINKKSQRSITVSETQDKLTDSSEDFQMSEDIIESSQDSSVTSISDVFKKIPVVKLDKAKEYEKLCAVNTKKKALDNFNNDVVPLSDTFPSNQESTEDIEISKNKTALEEDSEMDSTENMDTQPIEEKDSSSDVVIVMDDEISPIVINTEETCVGPETQEIAEADTELLDVESQNVDTFIKYGTDTEEITKDDTTHEEPIETQDIVNQTIPVSKRKKKDAEETGACSPLKDEVQKKKDFLNDTIEISPIKAMSPVPDNTSPSPETSSDYVVIKLTSPVQSNGEPFEKCDSPEIFTEDKGVSPDKRDQSPPRVQVIVNNTSPSSSLSLKKNRPQVRPGGRAAQMLDLCALEKLEKIMSSERTTDDDEQMKNTPARRNLRISYNSIGDTEPVNQEEQSEESESFLKLKRLLPTSNSSPSGPILKRKLIDITDEATISPASKRKRVSFHDPPVSTTVAVQKYIETGSIRSPQSSIIKRQERQARQHIGMKSPKRLDHAFKLDTILTKAVESFGDEVVTMDDTINSMDQTPQTPAVEVVVTSELNDKDPIYPELMDCSDSIDNIASQLSSPAMKELLVKELVGKVETIADLAKMTELEVNRLCIKAPKVAVVKKVLADYASKKAKTQLDVVDDNNEIPLNLFNDVPVPVIETVSAEVQTAAVVCKSIEMQTDALPVTLAHTQTETVPISHSSAQTIESGSKSTKNIVVSCIAERLDFVDQLGEHLQESSIRFIAEKLSFSASLDLLMQKMTSSNSTEALNKLISHQSSVDYSGHSDNKDLIYLRKFICNKFGSKDIILFCSELLKNVHDKPA